MKNAISTTQMKDAVILAESRAVVFSDVMFELERIAQKIGHLALEVADELGIFKRELNRPVFDVEIEWQRMAKLRAEIDALKEAFVE